MKKAITILALPVLMGLVPMGIRAQHSICQSGRWQFRHILTTYI